MNNGVVGGIGEGLSSFVQAYQTALNYQLEKAKAANQSDYQQKMAQAAQQTATAGLLNAGGSAAADRYGSPPHANQISDSTPQAPPAIEQAQNPTSTQSPVNPLPQGMMGPQPSSGLIASTQPKAQSLPSQGPPQSGPGSLAQSNVILAPWQREFQISQRKKVDELNAESQKSGSGQTWTQDPNTGSPVMAQGPLTGNAALERSQKQAQIAGETSGSRSPNATIAGQYDDRPAVKAARGSQINMNQMVDNYNHPSPQGDASLVLNAFKIKFPNQATDVNSIKELQESQAVPDQWKQQMTQALAGGLDQNTRDNLMRDGISTYRANVDSLRGEQAKFSKRAKANGVNDASFLEEPSIDKTYAQTSDLGQKLGPYTPPAERGDWQSKIYGLLSPSRPPANATPPDPKISGWAQQHSLSYPAAEQILKARGYGK